MAANDYIDYELDGRLEQSTDENGQRLTGIIRTKKLRQSSGARRIERCHQKKIDQRLKRIFVYVPQPCEDEVRALAKSITAKYLASIDDTSS